MAFTDLQSFYAAGSWGQPALTGERMTRRRGLRNSLRELYKAVPSPSLEEVRAQYEKWGEPEDLERIDNKIEKRDYTKFSNFMGTIKPQLESAVEKGNWEVANDLVGRINTNELTPKFIADKVEILPQGTLQFRLAKDMVLPDQAGNPRLFMGGTEIEQEVFRGHVLKADDSMILKQKQQMELTKYKAQQKRATAAYKARLPGKPKELTGHAGTDKIYSILQGEPNVSKRIELLQQIKANPQSQLGQMYYAAPSRSQGFLAKEFEAITKPGTISKTFRDIEYELEEE